jgi:hypothetical protein
VSLTLKKWQQVMLHTGEELDVTGQITILLWFFSEDLAVVKN